MATLTVQEIVEAGLAPAFVAAAAGGDAFANDDNVFLVVKNGDATSKTVTAVAQRTTFDQGKLGRVTVANLAVVVPNGEERWIKVPPAPYNDVNGKVQLTYSAVTNVTVGAVRIPRR